MKSLIKHPESLTEFVFRQLFPFNPIRYSIDNWFSNVVEEESSIKIEIDVPGTKQKDISISEKDGILTVEWKRKDKSFRESYGLFENVQLDKIDANLKDGILTITIPKKEENKPRQIEVKS